MDIQFHPIDSKANHYPDPHLPVLPLFDLSTLTLQTKTPPPTAFVKTGEFFTSARIALAQALKRSGIDKNQAVLIPAYHCGSMVEPALWLNSDVLLYQLNNDLSPNMDSIKSLIEQSTKPVTAMLLTHYFGFPQESQVWFEYCNNQGITLIEDCAHSFFGKDKSGTTIGATGHYAIASVKKFFCSPDGGILIEKQRGGSHNRLNRLSLKSEMQGLYQVVTRSAFNHRLGWIGLMIKRLDKWRTRHKISQKSSPQPALIQSRWQWFNPDLINTGGLRISKLFVKSGDYVRVVRKRRHNYQQLLLGIKDISGIKPLYPILPKQVVPYMFPVILSSGEEMFTRLKEIGLPIWRWEELAKSDCKVSQQYRLKLLQIPCHQTLAERDIEWMINALKSVVTTSNE